MCAFDQRSLAFLKGSGLGEDFEDAEAAAADQRGSFEFHSRCVLMIADLRFPRCPGMLEKGVAPAGDSDLDSHTCLCSFGREDLGLEATK